MRGGAAVNRKTVLILAIMAQAAAAEECMVDEVMQASLKAANLKSQAVVNALVEDRNVEEESCMPILRALGAGISATIPTMGNIASGIGTKIRNMACAAADDAVTRVAKNTNATWEAPYGLGGVSGGANATGQVGGSVKQNNAIDEFVTKQAEDMSKQVIGKAIGNVEQSVKQKTSGVTGINREAADKANQEFNDAKSKVLDEM